MLCELVWNLRGKKENLDQRRKQKRKWKNKVSPLTPVKDKCKWLKGKKKS